MLRLALLVLLAGNRLSAEDLWPQAAAFPDHAKISAVFEGGGATKVVGRAGAVAGKFPALVLCANSGAAVVTSSAEDGSFEARLVCLPGSWIVVKYDPTGASWVRPPFQVPASDVAMVWANSAPGTWLRVPPEAPPPGDGTPFGVSGLAGPNGLDFSMSGRMTGRFEPGGSVTLEGIATVYASTASAAGLAGTQLRIDADLGVSFDERGRPRAGTGYYYSNILTPTGFPVETKGRATFYRPGLRSEGLTTKAGGVLSAPFRWTVPLPDGLPPGTYSFSIKVGAEDGRAVPLAGLRGSRQVVMTRDLSALPPFKVGKPAAPRLIWTLLTDVPGADGSRGTTAAGDVADFALAGQVVTQSRAYVIPGSPVYRLEPYLPMVSQGDRHVPNPPALAFKFPSGSLTVRVRRPDGKTDVLGPAPFAAARSRAPSTAGGIPLNGHGAAPVDVFQLTSGTSAFDYRFPLYGRYELEMTGSVEDDAGNAYAGGGRYTVFVAERLDLEPAILPMTPLQAGDALNPGVTVLPGVPAEISVSVTHVGESDPRKTERTSVSGRANRFGVFTRKAGAAPLIMRTPGEFVVETTARYTDAEGVLWMGSSRWGQVVETPGSPLVAHGQRGRMDLNPAGGRWFDSPHNQEVDHMRFPYSSGDVVWQSEDDCLIAAITVQDREGLVAKDLRWIFAPAPELRRFRPAGGGDYRLLAAGASERRLQRFYDPKTAFYMESAFDKRALSEELPLPLVSDGLFSPASDPRNIRVHGYFYAAAERPGERVREVVSDDRGVQNRGYWRFDEPYGMQPGIGVQGDLPNDFKFLYAGAVFRDDDSGLKRYGIYGALWVHLPDGDARGTRVFPPFQGANGGPSGGPIMTLGGSEIEGFVVPLAARPGTILETGDAFSFSAAIAPPLPAGVEAVVTGPGGFRRMISGRANAVGYFYRPEQDFKVEAPGLYRVSVTATFDSDTSAGPMSAPFPTGAVLGAKAGGYDVYVVDRESPLLRSEVPSRSAIRGLGPVALPVSVPGGARGALRYTIAMPGFLLEEGSRALDGEGAAVAYDPLALSRTFPNLDVARGRTGGPPGLVDTVWVSMLAQGTDGRFHARQFTMQGPELYAP